MPVQGDLSGVFVMTPEQCEEVTRNLNAAFGEMQQSMVSLGSAFEQFGKTAEELADATAKALTSIRDEQKAREAEKAPLPRRALDLK